MLTNGVRVENRICVHCRSHYDANVVNILGHKIVLGNGMCRPCRNLKMEEEEKKEQTIKQLETARRRRIWRENCGIPIKFMNEDFATITKVTGNLLKIKSLAMKYAEGFTRESSRGYKSLLIFSHGVWGVGKTHIACSIAHTILNRWQGESETCPVLFVSEPNLFRRIRTTYDYRGVPVPHETEGDVIDRYIRTPLLILDDVGKEEVTDPRFVQRTLFSIINGRYENMLPMVITANLAPDQLAVHMGAGLGNYASFDRLAEMCKGEFHQVVGESYRSPLNRSYNDQD